MELSQLTTFLLVSVTLACTPGADWAYIISAATGSRSYHPAVWGLLSGYLMHTVLLVCGIAALVAGSPTALLWLTVAGSFYLLWLGVSTLRSFKRARFYSVEEGQPSTPDTVFSNAGVDSQGPNTGSNVALLEQTRKSGTARGSFFRGLLTSGTNPKALLLYVALIPQYLDATGSWPVSIQTGVFGLAHFAVSVLVYFSVAIASRALLRSRPAAARIVTLCSGIIMVCLALGLIYEQFFVA